MEEVDRCDEIDQFHKSHNAPVPYPRMHDSEQKCAHFCFEWCIVGYGTGALWDCELGQYWWLSARLVDLPNIYHSQEILHHHIPTPIPCPNAKNFMIQIVLFKLKLFQNFILPQLSVSYTIMISYCSLNKFNMY